MYNSYCYTYIIQRMEIAIPLTLLGGLYVVSNSDNKHSTNNAVNNTIYTNPVISNPSYNKQVTQSASTSQKEGFVNPVIAPTRNYPTVSDADIRNDTVRPYAMPNNIRDHSYNPDKVAKNEQNKRDTARVSMGGKIQEHYSLTGKKLDMKCFKHNNMVPYFGSKSHGMAYDNGNDHILDTKQGSGSQHVSKKEVAPLFKPEKNMQWGYGMPNQSDFIQSRMVPSLKMNNTKPWEEQRVAPGLNAGYGTEGTGLGFNTGMTDREKWMDRGVDELRVKNNPKRTFTYTGHEGPAHQTVKSRGLEGKIEKYLPDTFYVQGSDRWLTTTGGIKAPTNQSKQIYRSVNRPDTTTEYYGTAARDGPEASYIPGKIQESKRCELNTNPSINAYRADGQGAKVGDYGVEGFRPLPNNRSTTNNDAPLGIVSGTVKAIMAPILDIIRPTRKDNAVGNIRPEGGNPSSKVTASYVINPADRTSTTHRETMEKSLFHHNVQQKIEGMGYTTTEQQPVITERDTTNVSYIGAAGGGEGTRAETSYESAYNAQTNMNKEIISKNRPNRGGTQLYDPTENVRSTKLESDRDNNRMWVPSDMPKLIPSKQNIGGVQGKQKYNTRVQNDDRMNPYVVAEYKRNPYTHGVNAWA
jgi:hypothetical protein